MTNVIITCAPTGSIHTPSMSPHLPVTPEEIAEAAIQAVAAGAAIVHLHARDATTGKPTQDPAVFAAHQIRLTTMGLTLGSHVRVGLEDSLWDGPGTLAKSNADQVRRIRALAELLHHEIATPDEARSLLGLKGRA